VFLSIKACKPKQEEPRINLGVHTDLNVHIEGFLERIPQHEHIPIIHALLFLSETNLDPDFYEGKTVQDIRQVTYSDEQKYKLNNSTVTEVLDQAQKLFNQTLQKRMEDLKRRKQQLTVVEQELLTQRQEEEMLYRIEATDIRYEYRKVPPNVSVSITFTLKNGSIKEIEGFDYSVQFEEKSTGRHFEKLQRNESFTPAIPVGGQRSFHITVSNCPKLPNVAMEQYPQYFKPLFMIENAYMLDGSPFRRPLNRSLNAKRIKLRQEVEEWETVLGKAKERRRFSFWAILSQASSKE